MFYVMKDKREIFQERYRIYHHGLQATHDLALAYLLDLIELFPKNPFLAILLQPC